MKWTSEISLWTPCKLVRKACSRMTGCFVMWMGLCQFMSEYVMMPNYWGFHIPFILPLFSFVCIHQVFSGKHLQADSPALELLNTLAVWVLQYAVFLLLVKQHGVLKWLALIVFEISAKEERLLAPEMGFLRVWMAHSVRSTHWIDILSTTAWWLWTVTSQRW